MLRRYTLLTIGFVALGFAWWMRDTWGPLSVEQVLYHLTYADLDAVHMSEAFLPILLADVLAIPLAFGLWSVAMLEIVRRAARRCPARLEAWLCTGMVAVAFVAVCLQMSAFSWFAAHLRPDNFSRDYTDPSHVRIEQRGTPRNLILIYAESLERGYGNAQAMGRNLLEPLDELRGQSFDAYRQAPGTSWTMAGIVATQCGIPLRVYSEFDLKTRPGGKTFLAGATCLGDLLGARGYRNVFMGGAPLSFAGKGAFLRDHGYAERYGREEWIKAGARRAEMHAWGLYDDALFVRARERLARLQANGAPFNLTLLTIDTHQPFGLTSPGCRARGVHDFSGIVHCSAQEIAGFIASAQRDGLLRNTVVVVVGDHLARPNPLWDELHRAGDRGIFNLIVAPQPVHLNRSDVLAFDMYPTLLESMGFRVQGHRLALGYSGLNEGPAPGPLDERVQDADVTGSSAYSALWRRP